MHREIGICFAVVRGDLGGMEIVGVRDHLCRLRDSDRLVAACHFHSCRVIASACCGLDLASGGPRASISPNLAFA